MWQTHMNTNDSIVFAVLRFGASFSISNKFFFRNRTVKKKIVCLFASSHHGYSCRETLNNRDSLYFKLSCYFQQTKFKKLVDFFSQIAYAVAH